MIMTYEDGSQRVGEEPFPVLSPLEQAAGKQEPAKAEPASKNTPKKKAE